MRALLSGRQAGLKELVLVNLGLDVGDLGIEVRLEQDGAGLDVLGKHHRAAGAQCMAAGDAELARGTWWTCRVAQRYRFKSRQCIFFITCLLRFI